MTRLGFNGGLLDIKAKVVEKIILPVNDKSAVQAIIDKKAINRAGGLFKLGVVVANYGVIMEASKRIKVTEKREKETKVNKKKDSTAKVNDTAVDKYWSWRYTGRKVDPDTGHPIMNKDTAVAIVKVPLPECDPNANSAGYKNMGPCIKRLGSLAGGTTWEEEMIAYDAKRRPALPARLF